MQREECTFACWFVFEFNLCAQSATSLRSEQLKIPICSFDCGGGVDRNLCEQSLFRVGVC